VKQRLVVESNPAVDVEREFGPADERRWQAQFAGGVDLGADLLPAMLVLDVRVGGPSPERRVDPQRVDPVGHLVDGRLVGLRVQSRPPLVQP
jgi:hypothetical protein